MVPLQWKVCLEREAPLRFGCRAADGKARVKNQPSRQVNIQFERSLKRFVYFNFLNQVSHPLFQRKPYLISLWKVLFK
jgi:hypothetical protein